MIYLIVIGLALLAGLLYRMGGMGDDGKARYPSLPGWLFSGKVRDAGVPLIMVIAMIVLGHFHWSLILCYGALWGALSTYNKWVGYFLNRTDKSTVYWESWLVTGIFYGLAMLPYVIFSHEWLDFGIRTAICGALVCLLSQFIGIAWLEESGRGFIIISSLLLFLI